MKIKWIFLISLVLIVLSIAVGCAPSTYRGLNNAVNSATRSYRFNILNWEVNSIIGEIKQTYDNRNLTVSDTQTVVDYFNGTQQNSLSTSEIVNARDRVEKHYRTAD